MLEVITKLPSSQSIIGTREIVKNINAGRIKVVVTAKNCPDELLKRIPDKAKIKMFDGDEKQLGTKLGKPFAVAMAGYESE